jgi:hypothetical protein
VAVREHALECFAGVPRQTPQEEGGEMLKSRLVNGVVGVAMLSLLAAGCGTLGGAAVGAGAGAAVGAGTGYGAGKGALIGTGVGAAAGAIYDITKKN